MFFLSETKILKQNLLLFDILNIGFRKEKIMRDFQKDFKSLKNLKQSQFLSV